MHAEKVIPNGYEGRTAKITIQGYQDRRPFIYYATVLREDDRNLYVMTGKYKIIFRKQHIYSIEFPKHSEGELSKPDSVQTGKEAKVIYRIGGKSQVVFGKILEDTDSYLYVKLTDKQYRMIMRHCIVSITYPGDKSDKKKRDWTNHVHRKRKPNDFSYTKWWSREDVEEVE